MKRVCCFCERWESGGIESFLFNVLMRIDLSEINVDIIASSIGESIFTEPLKKRGICFYELSGKQQNIIANHSLFRKIVRERKYNVIHLNIFHGLSLAYLKIAKEEGVRIRIAHSHGAGLRKSKTRLIKLIIHNIAKGYYVKFATDLFACSKAAACFLFPKKVNDSNSYCIIRNGIDVDKFCFNLKEREKQRKSLGLDNNLIIGNVGRLSNEKNQMFLIEVLAEILKISPNARLILVGEGNEKGELQKRAYQLEVADKVLFYGTSNHVEQLLWAMDIFAFPSLMEGLGISAIEAQAAGLPVVCSQFVPAETYVTSHIYSIPLSAGSAAWAASILKHAGRFENNEYQSNIETYDISKTVAQVMPYYMR